MCGAVAFVSAFAVHLYRRDRQELVEEFRDERLKHVKDAARVIDVDLEAVQRDLVTASDLLQDSYHAESALHALLAFVSPYKLLAVANANGAVGFAVSGPGAENLARQPEVREAMTDRCRAALALPPRMLTVSMPLPAHNGTLRVFATKPPPTPDSPLRAVALVVDTEPLFEKLVLLAPDEDSRVLVLGHGGGPLPPSNRLLTLAVGELAQHARDLPGLSELDSQDARWSHRNDVDLPGRGAALRAGVGTARGSLRSALDACRVDGSRMFLDRHGEPRQRKFSCAPARWRDASPWRR